MLFGLAQTVDYHLLTFNSTKTDNKTDNKQKISSPKLPLYNVNLTIDC